MCVCHGGWHQLNSQKAASMKRYKLMQYQGRLDQLTDSNAIKSLRDEIAIVRMLVQTHLDVSNGDETYLDTYASVVRRFVNKIQSLASTCATIENKLKEFMDTTNALELAHDVISAVRKHKPDSGIVAEEITEAIGNLLREEKPATKLSNYEIGRWAKHVLEFATSERVISLRNEIGIIRLDVEMRLNRAQTQSDLIHQAGPICDAIGQIESLVATCHRLEDATGLLLDKEKAAAFVDRLLTIVGTHEKDSEILERISSELDKKPQ